MRRGGLTPHLVMLHYTAMRSAEAALERLCDPAHAVSAHYLIAEDGRAWHLVEEGMRSWHAGAGSWRGQTDINSRSIGIELANDGRSPFPEPQMAMLEDLLSGICRRWSIPPEAVIAHSDAAPERKHDPGRRFDWRRLARSGLSIWPEPCASGVEATPDAFVALARSFGYPDLPCDLLLDAFRQRFRPWARGPLSPQDIAAVQHLARRHPVDGAVVTA